MTMNSLSMIESRLPPGFRFHPRDEELVCDYLANKLFNNNGNSFGFPGMIDVDLNKCEPWELPEMACVGGKVWYFYSLKDRKYATGQRTNRATQSGYWKATGKDRTVRRRGLIVGMRKTLVFYEGRAPKGRKTNWVMHEFRIEGSIEQQKFSQMEDWVLCRVFYKSKSTNSKTDVETSYDDELGSSTLPPLTENYITFEQEPLEGHEQVPCFSNLAQNPSSQCSNVLSSHVPLAERNLSVKSTINMATLNDYGPCDNKVLKVVLNHFKFEANPNNELLQNTNQGNLENYLCGNGFPYMWTSM